MSDKKPNILLLFTDQQRFDTIAAAGYSYMKTPNLDRLVNEGCLYNHAYSPNPVCIPARINVLTGLTDKVHGYSNNYGHPLDHKIPTIPRILADNGYDTRAIGKMHFGPPRRHNGFAKMELMEEGPRFREDDEYMAYLMENGYGNIQNIHGIRNLLYYMPQRSLIPEEHHGSTWVGDRSAEYIKKTAGRRPFFLWASWIAPHPPFDIPDTYADMYRDADLPEPIINETGIDKNTELRQGILGYPEGDGMFEKYTRRMREVYYSSISLVDKNIGKVLDALEESGEMDNTVIIFTTDHGELLGDYKSFGKSICYDTSARIPFIIRYPEKIKPGSIDERFCDLNDIMPTILDAAGLEYPGGYELPGGSLFNDTDKDRQYQYTSHSKDFFRWVSIRDRKFKYNYFFRGTEELFDMENDPQEKVNLLQDNAEQYKEIKDKLRKVAVSYEQKWGPEAQTTETDFADIPDPEIVETSGINTQFPKFTANVTDKEELELLNDFGDEVLMAVKEEPLAHLENLNLKMWLERGGPEELIKKYLD
ncbi:MAG: sulfatase family protein [Planctomycetota bacterium]|jgi:arylsulfatase A-like enzyme